MTCVDYCPYVKENPIYKNKDRVTLSIPGSFISDIILEDGKSLREIYPIEEYKNYRLELLLGEELSRYGTN